MGQSRALLIVSELIERHNEMSGAGIIVGCRPAATGLPLHGDAANFRFALKSWQDFNRMPKTKCLAEVRRLDLEDLFSKIVMSSVSDFCVVQVM